MDEGDTSHSAGIQTTDGSVGMCSWHIEKGEEEKYDSPIQTSHEGDVDPNPSTREYSKEHKGLDQEYQPDESLIIKYADFHTAISPRDAKQLFELAQHYSTHSTPASNFLAEQMFLRALKTNPHNKDFIEEYSKFLLKSNPVGAVAIYRESLERSPWKAALFFSFAVFSAEVLMNLDQAEQYFLRAIEIDAKPTFLKTMGLFLKFVRGQSGRAKEFLDRYEKTKDSYKPPPHYHRKLSFDNDSAQLISFDDRSLGKTASRSLSF